MGGLLKLMYDCLPFSYFGAFFNHDGHSIVSKKGKKIINNIR